MNVGERCELSKSNDQALPPRGRQEKGSYHRVAGSDYPNMAGRVFVGVDWNTTKC